MLLTVSFVVLAWSRTANSQQSSTTTTTSTTFSTTTTENSSDNSTTTVLFTNTTNSPTNTTQLSNLTTTFVLSTTTAFANDSGFNNTTTFDLNSTTTTFDYNSTTTASPTTTVVPLTTKTTASASKCEEHRWPDLDNHVTCGACKVLVTNMNRKYQTCSAYCGSIGRDCLGAWEEVQDSCVVKSTETCDHRFGSYTSDAICQCSDRSVTGPKPGSTVLKCFYKPATSLGKPQLQTCGKDEDACLIAYMRHEDGNFYTRQKCINSTEEAPFYRGHGGILQPYCRDWPLEGTYVCACDYSGCNWEKFSAGYITPAQRIAPLLILLLIILGITCCCCCCFGSSQKKGHVHYR